MRVPDTSQKTSLSDNSCEVSQSTNIIYTSSRVILKYEVQIVSSCLQSVRGLALSYIAEFCRPVSLVDVRFRPRSATRGDFIIPPTITEYGKHYLSAAAPA